MTMTIKQEPFGQTSQGETVTRYTLTNAQGTEVSILNLGGIIQSLKTADKNGHFADIVLGCDNVADYENQSAYLGALCGRYANRIREGQLVIDGRHYQLACNNGPNHLHGGNRGYNQRIWSVSAEHNDTEARLTLRYQSPDGEEGYPGNLDIQVTYCLNSQNELTVSYCATTDKTTVVNLTNHSYFNLKGSGSCLEHELQLVADSFVPTNASAIPFGDIKPVAGTPMDFREPRVIGQDIDADNQQLLQALGYDHSWVINQGDSRLKECAVVIEPETGRSMTVKTTQPAVQFYTGNFLDDLPGKAGRRYNKRDGFCLETQHFPDSPNQADFPSTELKPGEVYDHTTVFAFGLSE
ncbi:galactose mutarotase [Endozoicomonas gorgoniicola]|uniref:Aldose 1-epimerase n=1 Tax=Endozoicomonas gorgoniicola TaxID=1234144 RepID=A0ABT3N2Z1_9GAMM|nr:aldose epimerase family protein [Endozoicomonas gorgoniicola]MCW7555992.1 galactose mutarotase [Endozoicomonas gorgoniicola]